MKKIKKLVAPVLITFFLILYALFYVGISIYENWESHPIIKIVLLIIAIGFIILCVSMLIERIREVKGGEEDDLSKY